MLLVFILCIVVAVLILGAAAFWWWRKTTVLTPTVSTPGLSSSSARFQALVANINAAKTFTLTSPTGPVADILPWQQLQAIVDAAAPKGAAFEIGEYRYRDGDAILDVIVRDRSNDIEDNGAVMRIKVWNIVRLSSDTLETAVKDYIIPAREPPSASMPVVLYPFTAQTRPLTRWSSDRPIARDPPLTLLESCPKPLLRNVPYRCLW